MCFEVTDMSSKCEAGERLNTWCISRGMEPTDNWLPAKMEALELSRDRDEVGIYDVGQQPNAASNVFICSTELLRKGVTEHVDDDGVMGLYSDNPTL